MAVMDFPRKGFQFRPRWPTQNLPVLVDALINSESHVARNQWLDGVEKEIVEFRACLSGNLDRVLKSFSRDEGDASPFALQQCIRSDGGAMQQGDWLP